MRPRRVLALSLGLAAVFTLVGLLVREMRASPLQARYLSNYVRDLAFRVEAGPSAAIRFPGPGPFDERLGYSRIPRFLSRLANQGYAIERQARASPALVALADRGLYPIYREKVQGGLSLFDYRGRPLISFAYPQRVYPQFEAVPALVVSTLLFIENRELLDQRFPSRNPAVEWDRLANAVLHRMVRLVDDGHNGPGASTLATQMEKYRHSPNGRTGSMREKLRQMVSASLRAYLNGVDTLPVRRQIVVDYLNTVPLAAMPGYGEVNGLGDGLWAWYGADFDQVNHLLRAGSGEPSAPQSRARAYRQVLSLLIAQRRPSSLLRGDGAQLQALTDSYLRLLAQAGVIDAQLRDMALDVPAEPRPHGVQQQPVSFVQRKAASAIRGRLAGLLEIPGLYGLDRLDLKVQTALDAGLQDAATRSLRQLGNADYARGAGLLEPRLLARGDPRRVIYSFTLMERGCGANRVRAQTDSLDQPFDINEGAKLDLGSTAKLRTLASYLEIVANLHARYSPLDAAALRAVEAGRRDRISRWALDYLARARDRRLEAMLEAALERRYSASPAEAFVTGGGVHRFENFKPEDDNRVPTVREAFRHSINLAFVRLMRDIVQHHMFQVPGSTATLLEDAGNPQRADYLSRFADREGREFVRRFFRKHQGKDAQAMWDSLFDGARPTPARLAVAFRAVAPDAGVEEFTAFLVRRLPPEAVAPGMAAALFEKYAPGRHSLADQGYLARVHPLELWTVRYLRQHPRASLAEAITASRDERQAVYRWLHVTRHKNAQDKRILSLLEVEAFLEVHRSWQRLGYPFESLVPSYATALGSSADRPAALAELMGIIANGGVRLPGVHIEALHFATATPYETRAVRQPEVGQRVMAPEVAAALRRALADVVESGTARRLAPSVTLADGTRLAVGGKTGTGDHRFEIYAAGGRLVESRVVNRAATFAFMLGDRYFGTVTAYVPGLDAAQYRFTSALPVQVLKLLLPEITPHLSKGTACAPSGGRTSVEAGTPGGRG